jgi:hypothetical protein
VPKHFASQDLDGLLVPSQLCGDDIGYHLFSLHRDSEQPTEYVIEGDATEDPAQGVTQIASVKLFGGAVARASL